MSSGCDRSTTGNTPTAAKPAPAVPATGPIARKKPATIASTRPNNLMDVVLKETDLPLQKLFLLKRGDRIVFTLPSGLRLVWDTKRDMAIAEQATRSGLKAHSSEPDFDKLKNYGVSTSGNYNVSIYRFDVDGYQVERAEDLRAEHFLPAIIRITKSGAGEMEAEAARALFDKDVPVVKGPPPRVPIGTVHDGLKTKFDLPFRLVVIDDQFSFDVFGNVADLDETARVKLLSEAMQYIVDRYEGIGHTSSFTFNLYKDDKAAFSYDAKRDQKEHWVLVRANAH